MKIWYILNNEGALISYNYYETKPEGNVTDIPLHRSFIKPVFENGEWTEGADEEEVLAAREIPQQVPLWAMKATLDIENKLGAVEAAMDQLPELVKKKAYWIWEYGNVIHRNSNTVAFIGQVLDMQPHEIDTLFINADNIEL
jgi:hypothetical protein